MPKLEIYWGKLQPFIAKAAMEFSQEKNKTKEENLGKRKLAEELREEMGLPPIPVRTEKEVKKLRKELTDEFSKLTSIASEVQMKLDALRTGHEIVNVKSEPP